MEPSDPHAEPGTAPGPRRHAFDLSTGEVWEFGDPAPERGDVVDGDRDREAGRTATCGSYHPGHDPHYIQHRLCRDETDPTDAARLVEIRSIADDGWIEFELDGEVHRRWNHRSGRLQRILAHHDDVLVTVSLRWHLLEAYRPDLSGAWLFNLGKRRTRCPDD